MRRMEESRKAVREERRRIYHPVITGLTVSFIPSSSTPFLPFLLL
jgi:hypothetical protein